MVSVIVKKGSQNDKEKVKNWPIWQKEVSRFDWFYDAEEHCYILEGEVDVETDQGSFHIVAGDYVIFKQGLECVWDIKKDLKKHYSFK